MTTLTNESGHLSAYYASKSNSAMKVVGDIASTKTISLLREIVVLNNASFGAINGLVTNSGMRVASDYRAALRKRDVDIGFNLFALISDLYYRENFHSDILRALIDPSRSRQ